MPTWYEVLGAPETADYDELRRAYRARARIRHPDAHATSTSARQASAQASMQELNAAWTVLGDPESRARYDQRLADDRRPRARPESIIEHSGASTDGDIDDEWADPAWDDDDWVESGILAVPRWVHRAIIGMIALVLIGLVVVSAHAGPQPIATYDNSVEPLDVNVAPVGRCLVIDASALPSEARGAGLTDCTERDTQLIRDTVDPSSGELCPVGTRSVTVPDYPLTLCVEGLG
jgi:hypothetical protein